MIRRSMIAAQTLAVAAAAMIAAAPARAVELTVTHWGVLMYGAPFAVAKEKGFFKQAGIDVTGFITSKGGGTTVRNIIAADVPYGEASLAAVVSAVTEGADFTIVHSGVQSAGDVLWVTRQDSGVQSIKDLKGKPVGFTSPKSVSQMLLVMSLDAAGMKYSDIEPKALGGIGANLTALEEKGVEAATVLEPIWTKVSSKYRPVFRAADMLPPITQTVGVIRTDWLKANPDKAKAIIEGRRKGVEFIYANPKEAAAIVAKVYDVDQKQMEQAVANLVAMKYWSPGNFDLNGMNNMVRGLKLIGATEQDAVDWSKLIDESYLAPDLRSRS